MKRFVLALALTLALEIQHTLGLALLYCITLHWLLSH